ncbi:hypothetical protein [Neobacillus soli]|uniref:hypothetical protein n=1 Tax=Neobacillus soli TaxID=220688 RepID=UPI0008251A59|nr:hypothetical protein [Neobacillus soli]
MKATAESNSKSASAAEIDPTEWEDPSSENGSEKMEFTPTAQGWVAEQLEIFRQAPDSKLLEAGYDKGYDYFLKADVVSRGMGNYVRVEDVDLEKDFENLRVLANIIVQEQDARTADILPKEI